MRYGADGDSDRCGQKGIDRAIALRLAAIGYDLFLLGRGQRHLRSQQARAERIHRSFVRGHSRVRHQSLQQLPGFVDTALTAGLGRRTERMIRAEDVADAVAYVLASSANCCPTEIVIRPQLPP
jgi:NADP-dependent 3-hydroxy acid dehydrogenase YdfG